MTRAQLNLALLAVAGGLAAAVIFSQKKEEKGAPLTAMTADAVTKVRIEHPGAPAIALEKSGSSWMLTEPVKTAADSIEINGVLNLATLETKSTLKPGEAKLEDLGLAPPQYTVTLNDQKLEIGGVEPLEFRRYIRLGDTIALTDDPPGSALDADYSDLVAKQLLPEGSEVVGLQLPGLTVSRSPDGQSWQLKPEQAGASNDQKQKLVDGWKNARAMWNAAQADGELKGDEITVLLKDQSIKFVVVEREPQLVLARPDLHVRYTLSKALEDELLKLPEEKKAEEQPAGKPAEAPATAQSGVPELPEVETVRRGVEPHVVGHTITRVAVREPRLRWRVDRKLPEQLAGRRIESTSRRGKYLLLHLDSGDRLIVHLGMSGRFNVLPLGHALKKHDHVDIELSTGKMLRFNDARRFGAVLLWAHDAPSHKLLAGMGPEPFSEEFNGDYLFELSRGRTAPVKSFVMDGRVVVGAGNIYAAEALFRTGVRPSRPAGKLTRAQCKALARHIKDVLMEAVEQGGTTLRDFISAEGFPGYFQQKLYVYGRDGEKCFKCKSTIKRQVIGQRSSFYCPRCQK